MFRGFFFGGGGYVFIPLWQLRGSDLLSWGINVTNHKVLGDLLHVLIIEEAVEAQLVCRATTGQEDRGTESRHHIKYVSHTEWISERTIWTSDLSQKQEVHTETSGA